MALAIVNKVSWEIPGGIIEAPNKMHIGVLRAPGSRFICCLCKNPALVYHPIVLTGPGYPRCCTSYKTRLTVEANLKIRFSEFQQFLFHGLISLTEAEARGEVFSPSSIIEEILPFTIELEAAGKPQDIAGYHGLPGWLPDCLKEHKLGVDWYDGSVAAQCLLPTALLAKNSEKDHFDEASWDALVSYGVPLGVLNMARAADIRICRAPAKEKS